MATKRFMDAIAWNGIVTGLAEFKLLVCTEVEPNRGDNA
jgi:hypothetical protein